MTETIAQPQPAAKESTLPVFVAFNRHIDEAGPAPGVVDHADGKAYYGYFANSLGEQFVLIVDHVTKRGVLRAGDLGWREGVIIARDRLEDDVLLSWETRTWLSAAWYAATGNELKL